MRVGLTDAAAVGVRLGVDVPVGSRSGEGMLDAVSVALGREVRVGATVRRARARVGGVVPGKSADSIRLQLASPLQSAMRARN